MRPTPAPALGSRLSALIVHRQIRYFSFDLRGVESLTVKRLAILAACYRIMILDSCCRDGFVAMAPALPPTKYVVHVLAYLAT